ncbi:HAD-like domain-containing protein, partial [Blyttiomyces helicus]
MSVLCSDKTGTLTLGKMLVKTAGFLGQSVPVEDDIATVAPSIPGMIELQRATTLCCGAAFDQSAMDVPVAERPVKGDSTDTVSTRKAKLRPWAVTGVALHILDHPALDTHSGRLPFPLPPSQAILRFSENVSPGEPIHAAHEKLFEVPFNSKNKWMATISRARAEGGDTVLYAKGAPDILFTKCTTVMRPDGGLVPLSEMVMKEVVAMQEEWSSQGMRVLAVCRRSLAGIELPVGKNGLMEKILYAEMQGLTLVGMLGIRDPPRPDVKPAVEVMRRAGVRVFMVTGDFRLTAVAIAKQIGIITTESVDTIDTMRTDKASFERLGGAKPHECKPRHDAAVRSIVIVGSELDSISKEEWNVIAGKYTEMVFARTTPEQKLQIVEELKARGDNTVAVTGDGVNDAPALKAADIGVAMGAGSDVAKEAASLVLLNNDFASIVVAIEN